MKYLFLDIDGVLNSRAWTLRRCGDCAHEVERGFGACEACRYEAAQDTSGYVRMRRCFDPEAVARLDRFVRESGCQITVSSSWRIAHTLGEIEQFLREHGYSGPKLLDQTPKLNMNHLVCSDESPDQMSREGRGLEIELWLHKQHRDPGERARVQFAIVDDDSDMGRLSPWHVQTSWDHGLLDEHLPRLHETLRRCTGGLLRERHPMLRTES